MEFFLYCLFITLFILIGLNILYRRKYNRKLYFELEKEKEKYIEKNKQHLKSLAERDIEQLLNQRDKVEADLKQKIEYLHNMQDACAKLNIQIREQQEQAKIYESDQMAKTNKNIAIYENNQRMIVDAKIKAEADERQKAAELAFAQAMADMAQSSEAASARIEQMNEQIKTLQKEIADYSAKQTAINEAIMRQRALDEQKDFYRICIDEDYKSDIDFLLNAKKNLKKTEIIDKIIYDNYISKPVLEMIKRVLQNESFSGIYKITNLLTNEIYIGKSTDIKARWTNHAKTTFNCGTIASSILHINMRKYGIENFSFEVIEKVPKEQLSAREKFYIDFYKTKEFGLNERKGG